MYIQSISKPAITSNRADALLEFGDRYVQSKTGNIPHQKFPEPLHEAAIAKIPARSRAG
ncbi:MAG: DUF1636 domain-containing protein [Cyanosarcina radialis HA8281-LM2]|nr:DUF1636 domain-containing protein [Cyanosarcina radialis HA8281-LM2]